MNARKVLAAYGLWLAGVMSAGLAAWLLYRSRAVSRDLADRVGEWTEGDELELELD